MKIVMIAPELRRATRAMSAMPLPIKSALGRRITRKLVALAPSPRQDDVGIMTLDTLNPGIRLYRPAVRKSRGALLWVHGGGYVIGQPSQDDEFLIGVAKYLGIVVASVDYRLAPDHPFPAPLDDCSSAWLWLLASVDGLDIDPSQIAIGGQSAGGGLAAGLVQWVRDTSLIQPAAQWLFCPMLDDRTAARRDLDAVGHRIWNNDRNAFGWRCYLGMEPGVAHVPPYASPSRRVDLGGLPPTWIGVGSVDLFCDEDRIYADRLAAAGIEVRFQIVAGAPHGFEAWASSTTLARTLIADAHAWLREKLA